jgi:hypothetical protein
MRREHKTRNQLLQERYGVPDYLLRPLPEERLPPISDRIRWCWSRLTQHERANFLAEIGWNQVGEKTGVKAGKKRTVTKGSRR